MIRQEQNDHITKQGRHQEHSCSPSFFSHFTMFPCSIVGDSDGIRILIGSAEIKNEKINQYAHKNTTYPHSHNNTNTTDTQILHTIYIYILYILTCQHKYYTIHTYIHTTHTHVLPHTYNVPYILLRKDTPKCIANWK